MKISEDMGRISEAAKALARERGIGWSDYLGGRWIVHHVYVNPELAPKGTTLTEYMNWVEEEGARLAGIARAMSCRSCGGIDAHLPTCSWA